MLGRRLEPGIHVRCKSLPPATEVPWHDHGMSTLCVVFGGSVTEEDARSVRHRRPGDLLFRPEPDRHRNRVSEEGVRILTLEIESGAMESLREDGLDLNEPVSAQSQRAARMARRVQVELSRPDSATTLELQGLAFQLMAAAVRCQRSGPTDPPAWLEDVRARLQDDFRSTPSLGALAREHGVSAHRLSRAFRRCYGSHVGEFLRGLRLARAMDLLAGSADPIADVALESGFFDQSHLTNVFRKRTGLTPAEFRRRSRNGGPDSERLRE